MCRFFVPVSDFVPFIVTAVLPTVISAQWRGIDSHRLTRDEQTWLSTTYVQIYAFLQVTGKSFERDNTISSVVMSPLLPSTVACSLDSSRM